MCQDRSRIDVRKFVFDIGSLISGTVCRLFVNCSLNNIVFHIVSKVEVEVESMLMLIS